VCEFVSVCVRESECESVRVCVRVCECVSLCGVKACIGAPPDETVPHKIAGQTSPSIHPPIGNSYGLRDFLP
jgi:hypothetical protein